MFSEGFPSFQNQLFIVKHNTSNYLFSHHFQDRKEWFDYWTLAIRFLSPSFVFFLQALMSRAQQKPPREQHHPGLYNVLLLPPELHKCSSLTKSFLPMFLFIFPSFPVLPIHLFLSPILTILVLQVCCMYPLKQWFLYRRAWNFLNATGAVHEWGWVLLDPSSIDSFWEFRVPTTEPTINLL